MLGVTAGNLQLHGQLEAQHANVVLNWTNEE